MNLKTLTTTAFAAMISLATFTTVQAGSIKTDMLDPVVKINENCSAEGVSIPEGKRLLTAAHCVHANKEGTFQIILRDDENKYLKITHVFFDVVRTDTEKDLALLKVRDETQDFSTVEIAEKLVAEEGDQVWTVGYPLAFNRVITEGLFNEPLILDFTGNGKEVTRLRASPGIDGGNSGGALFQRNGNDYELIGVTSMKMRSNDFMGIYIPLKDIREFLRLDVKKAASPQIDLQ